MYTDTKGTLLRALKMQIIMLTKQTIKKERPMGSSKHISLVYFATPLSLR